LTTEAEILSRKEWIERMEAGEPGSIIFDGALRDRMRRGLFFEEG